MEYSRPLQLIRNTAEHRQISECVVPARRRSAQVTSCAGIWFQVCAMLQTQAPCTFLISCNGGQVEQTKVSVCTYIATCY